MKSVTPVDLVKGDVKAKSLTLSHAAEKSPRFLMSRKFVPSSREDIFIAF